MSALAALAELAQSSLGAWDIASTELVLIKHRENAVYKVVASDGRRYALRLHRSGYHSHQALRSELQWMAALQASGLDVPEVVPTVRGELFAVLPHPGSGEDVQIDLFEWIDGVQLGTSEGGLGGSAGDIAHTYRTIGGIAARLHNHGETWTPPEGFHRHAWDAEGLVGEQPLWGRFWELEQLTEAQRALLMRARRAVAEELAAMTRNDAMEDAESLEDKDALEDSADRAETAARRQVARYGLIHADFAPENLLVGDGKVRLLDFDDAGYGWHLFELATALYFIQHDPQFELARDSLVDGYRAFRPLPDAVLEKLSVFMLARGFTYLGWVHTRKHSATARELAPGLIALACGLAEEFLAR
jgi:Ser/Thr protein kinase RdoA (MazF antagonist)